MDFISKTADSGDWFLSVTTSVKVPIIICHQTHPWPVWPLCTWCVSLSRRIPGTSDRAHCVPEGARARPLQSGCLGPLSSAHPSTRSLHSRRDGVVKGDRRPFTPLKTSLGSWVVGGMREKGCSSLCCVCECCAPHNSATPSLAEHWTHPGVWLLGDGPASGIWTVFCIAEPT